MSQWNKWIFGLALAVLIAACNTSGGNPPNPAPTQITNLTDSVNTNGSQPSVILNWNALSGASSYSVERKTGTGDFSQIGSVSTNTYTDTTVVFSTTYTYRINSGTAKSAERQVVVGAQNGGPGPGPGPQAPSVPQNVLAYAVSSNSGIGVRIVWQAPATGENITYTVQRRLGSGNFSVLTANLTITEYTDTTAQGSLTYIYQVQAVNGGGSSNFIQTNEVPVPASCAARVGNEASNAGLRGCFGAVVDTWPVVPTFSALLPDGKVIGWYASDPEGVYRESTSAHNTQPRTSSTLGVEDRSLVAVWNPKDGSFTSPSPNLDQSGGKGTDLFCAGYTVMTDGRFFTAGGNIGNTWGSIRTNVFDPLTRLWSKGPDQNLPNLWRDRWYPTVTKLPSGSLLISGGSAQPDSSFNPATPSTYRETPQGDSLRPTENLCRTDSGNCPPGLRDGTPGPLGRGILQGFNNSFEVYSPPSASNQGRITMLDATAANIPSFEHYYPWFHVAPNGSVFLAGAGMDKAFLNIGTGSASSWSTVWNTSTLGISDAHRVYGTSVMYEPGKIMVIGGGYAADQWVGSPARRTIVSLNNQVNGKRTIHITLGASSSTTPNMMAGPAMQYSRTHANATLMADGRVLVSGGQQDGGETPPSFPALPMTADQTDVNWPRTVNPDTIWNNDLAVKTSEIWTPSGTSGGFNLGARASQPRMYHSVAMLLPDATVLTAAGGGCGTCDNLPASVYGSLSGASSTVRMQQINQKNHEVFYPPYLFNSTGSLASRPVIQSTNIAISNNYPTLTYNSTFNLTWAHPTAGRSISKVTFIALGAPTHSFNQNQRYLELPIQSQSGNTLTVRTPFDGMYGATGSNSARNVAPPGFYMVFILDNTGVPSTAQIVRIQ